MPAPTLLPLDLTGSAAGNLIIDEVHTFTVSQDRRFVPSAGPFYPDSLVVRDNTSGRIMVPNLDYKVILPQRDAQMASGLDVSGAIWVNDTTAGSVRIRYQAVGGIYSNLYDTIIELLNNIPSNTLFGQVSWNQVFGQPVQYPPTSHMHDVRSLFNMGDVVNVLEKIRLAILTGDQGAFAAMYQYITNLMTNSGYITGTAFDSTVDSIWQAIGLDDTRLKSLSNLHSYGVGAVVSAMITAMLGETVDRKPGMIGRWRVNANTLTIAAGSVLCDAQTYSDTNGLNTPIPRYGIAQTDFQFSFEGPVTQNTLLGSVFAKNNKRKPPPNTFYYPNNIDHLEDYNDVCVVEYLAVGPFDLMTQFADWMSARTDAVNQGYVEVLQVAGTSAGVGASEVAFINAGSINPVPKPTSNGLTLKSNGNGNRSYEWVCVVDEHATNIGLEIMQRGSKSYLGICSYTEIPDTAGRCYVGGLYRTVMVGSVQPVEVSDLGPINFSNYIVYYVYLHRDDQTGNYSLMLDQVVSDNQSFGIPVDYSSLSRRSSHYRSGDSNTLFIGMVAQKDHRWLVARNWFQDEGVRTRRTYRQYVTDAAFNDPLTSGPVGTVQFERTQVSLIGTDFGDFVDAGNNNAALSPQELLLWKEEVVEIQSSLETSVYQTNTATPGKALIRLTLEKETPATPTPVVKVTREIHNLIGATSSAGAIVFPVHLNLSVPYVSKTNGLYNLRLQNLVTDPTVTLRIEGDATFDNGYSEPDPNYKSHMSFRLTDTVRTRSVVNSLSPVPRNDLVITVDGPSLCLLSMYCMYQDYKASGADFTVNVVGALGWISPPGSQPSSEMPLPPICTVQMGSGNYYTLNPNSPSSPDNDFGVLSMYGAHPVTDIGYNTPKTNRVFKGINVANKTYFSIGSFLRAQDNVAFPDSGFRVVSDSSGNWLATFTPTNGIIPTKNHIRFIHKRTKTPRLVSGYTQYQPPAINQSYWTDSQPAVGTMRWGGDQYLEDSQAVDGSYPMALEIQAMLDNYTPHPWPFDLNANVQELQKPLNVEDFINAWIWWNTAQDIPLWMRNVMVNADNQTVVQLNTMQNISNYFSGDFSPQGLSSITSVKFVFNEVNAPWWYKSNDPQYLNMPLNTLVGTGYGSLYEEPAMYVYLGLHVPSTLAPGANVTLELKSGVKVWGAGGNGGGFDAAGLNGSPGKPAIVAERDITVIAHPGCSIAGGGGGGGAGDATYGGSDTYSDGGGGGGGFPLGFGGPSHAINPGPANAYNTAQRGFMRFIIRQNGTNNCITLGGPGGAGGGQTDPTSNSHGDYAYGFDGGDGGDLGADGHYGYTGSGYVANYGRGAPGSAGTAFSIVASGNVVNLYYGGSWPITGNTVNVNQGLVISHPM